MHAQLSPACMRDLGGTAVGRALAILGEWLLVTIFVVDAWSSLIYIFCSPVALKYLSIIYCNFYPIIIDAHRLIFCMTCMD